MGYIDMCEQCGSSRVQASFGPYGFRMACLSCGVARELDDLLEPTSPSTPATRVAPAAGWEVVNADRVPPRPVAGDSVAAGASRASATGGAASTVSGRTEGGASRASGHASATGVFTPSPLEGEGWGEG